MRCLIPTIVAIQIEDEIKRYLLAHPELLPEDSTFEEPEDFAVLLADYFVAMSGVSGGSWTTGYLASKGGDGAARRVFRQRRIIRDYGQILPGEALGLVVFFREYGNTFFPGGPPDIAITPPMVNVSAFPSVIAALATNPTQLPEQVPFELPTVDIPGINSAVYSVEGLEETLELFLGDTKLSDLYTHYVMHAYDLNRRRNVYFIHNTQVQPSVTFTSHVVTRDRPREIPEDTNDEDFMYTPDNNQEDGLDFYMREVVRASSAVAMFHEAKVLSPVNEPNITYTFIDGSHITNNPALQGLIFLTSGNHSVPVEQVAMISLGTGVSYDNFAENADSGPLGWLLNNELLSIMGDGGAENVQSEVDYLFYGNPLVRPNQYLRVQYSTERNTTEGDALSRVTEYDDLPVYEEIGDRVARRYKSAIRRFVSEFIFSDVE